MMVSVWWAIGALVVSFLFTAWLDRRYNKQIGELVEENDQLTIEKLHLKEDMKLLEERLGRALLGIDDFVINGSDAMKRVNQWTDLHTNKRPAHWTD